MLNGKQIERAEQTDRLLAAVYRQGSAHLYGPSDQARAVAEELVRAGDATSRTARCDETGKISIMLTLTDAGRSRFENMLIDDQVARRLTYREIEQFERRAA